MTSLKCLHAVRFTGPVMPVLSGTGSGPLTFPTVSPAESCKAGSGGVGCFVGGSMSEVSRQIEHVGDDFRRGSMGIRAIERT
jgi:hypothetical protein